MIILDWNEWEKLVNKSFIELGFDVEKRMISEICKDLSFDVQRDGFGKHVSFPNLIVDIECKKHQKPIDYDIINNSFGIKDSLERKGFTVISVVASFEGFSERAQQVAVEKGILLLSKEKKEILEKISKDIDLLKYNFIMEKPQERVPNISGTEDFEFFDRLEEMLKIFKEINIIDPPITSEKITSFLSKHEKFSEKHKQIKEEGKFTFLQDYKKMFDKIMNVIEQESVGNKIEIFLTNKTNEYLTMSRENQKTYFLKHLLGYEGFINYLILQINAPNLVKKLKNQVEVRNFKNWIHYLNIENDSKNLEVLLSCSKILKEIISLKLHFQVSNEIDITIWKILELIIKG